MPGTKHIIADGLSRRPRGPSDDVDELVDTDVDNFIDVQLNCVYICPASLPADKKAKILEEGYSEKSK